MNFQKKKLGGKFAPSPALIRLTLITMTIFIRLLIGDEDLKTSQYDVSQGGWVEKDPETTQSFKRRQQVRRQGDKKYLKRKLKIRERPP